MEQTNKLSVIMITKNAEEIVEKSLNSIKNLADEIIIIDNYSTDQTMEKAKRYGAKIYQHQEENLGLQKAYALSKASGYWILSIDSDEIVSTALQKEIIKTIESDTVYNGYYIPFQNHFLGRPINYGGENYKMLRLFKKSAVEIKPSLVHESFQLKAGQAGILKNKIHHYSYRSIPQTFSKFTDYAIREAKQKAEKGERTSLKKIFLYPLHMFWARFIKDKGYKDGYFRIILDFGFAYMEFLTYFVMFCARIVHLRSGLEHNDNNNQKLI